MGSLTSRPKLPPVQNPVLYQPAPPASVTKPSPATQDVPAKREPGGDNAAEGADSAKGAKSANSDEKKAEARSLGLLGRSRGRLSTVVTGFRGLLSQDRTVPDGKSRSRKTLLGE